MSQDLSQRQIRKNEYLSQSLSYRNLSLWCKDSRYSRNIQRQRKKSKLTSFNKDWCCMMILTPRCSLSFFTSVWIKKKINTERTILFVLLALQMSGLFSYKLGFAALLTTTIISLASVVFIIFKPTNRPFGKFYTVCVLRLC